MRTETAERPDDTAQRGVVDEDEVDGHGLAIDRPALDGGLLGRYHAGQGGEGRRAALESIELEAEDGLALDPLLELVRRADGEDPAMVDDGDPVAQLVRLGHVVGGQQ